MPRFCSKCGAKLSGHESSCPACGAPVEDDVQIFTPHKSQAAEEAAVRARRKKRLITAAGAVVLLGAGVFALQAIGREHTPQKTAHAFQAALAAGDYDEICSVAELSGGDTPSPEQLEPMLSLYRESAAFRQQAANLTTASGGSLHLEKRSALPFSGYRVVIEPCRLEVVSNMADAAVSAGPAQSVTEALVSAEPALDGTLYPDDYQNLVRSAAVFDSLLPGLYDLTLSYTTDYGQSFQASSTVSLLQPMQTELNLDYTSLYIWNSSDMSVDISVDGTYFNTLPVDSALQLAPLQPDATVTATCTTQAGEALISSVSAGSRSFEVRFDLGSVDVYNDYPADMAVTLGGADYGVIPAKSLRTFSGVSMGSVLRFSLSGSDIFSPYSYRVTYDYDSICPILALSEDSSAAVCDVLTEYLQSAPFGAEDDDLIAGLDRLLLENGWSRSDVEISGVTVEDVFAMEPAENGTLLRLSGFYTCTNTALLDSQEEVPPEETPEEPLPDDSATGDVQTVDVPAEPAEITEDAPAVPNPQTQSFYASMIYDGEAWYLAK